MGPKGTGKVLHPMYPGYHSVLVQLEPPPEKGRGSGLRCISDAGNTLGRVFTYGVKLWLPPPHTHPTKTKNKSLEYYLSFQLKARGTF